jgi:hypothetical protein
MDMKHILADLGGQTTDDLVLELAWQVARLDQAHISVLHMRRDRSLPAPDGMFAGIDRLMSRVDGLVVDELPEDGYDGELAVREDRARVAFQSFLSRRQVASQDEPGGQGAVTASWRVERTSDAAALTHLARVCDLMVMARPTGPEIDLSDDADAVMLGTGRPILLAPATQLAGHVERDVLVAWDGSVEATRAVGLALPLLAHAGRVRIFSRAHGTAADPVLSVTSLMSYLARHGVAAEPAGVAHLDLPVVADLLATCLACNSSLLVMGAYHHSRAREAVLGGVTQHVLEHAALPVLMAP